MSSSTATGLVKGLGLLDSTTLVMGSMIGSGIFIVSADIARQTQSPGLLIVTWIVAAALTMIAALSYGALAIAVIVLLSVVNSRGIRTGAAIQNVFTFAKTAALLCLVALGFLLGRNPQAVSDNFHGFWRNAGWSFETIRIAGVAMVGALF